MEKRRIIPAFLVLFVIFAIVPHPGAAAAGMSGLEVVGQTAMSQQTFTDLSIIGADSCGLTDAINGSKNPAQSIGEWIKGEWDNWLLRQQLTWGTVLNIAAAGARYTGNGDLLFNSQLSDLFTRFYNWLWDGEDGPNIKDNAEVVPGESGDTITNVGAGEINNSLYYPEYGYNLNVGSGVCTLTLQDGRTRTYSGAENYIVLLLNDSYSIICVGEQSFTVQAKSPNNGYTSYGSTRIVTKDGDYFFEVFRSGVQSTSNTASTDPGYSTISGLNSMSSDVTPSIIADICVLIYNAPIGEDQILGDPNKLGGLTGADTNVVAPPDVINWPDFGGNGGYIDVNDYITGVRGAIESQDGTADVNITDSEGVESTQTMEIDQTTDIPVESETTADMVNQGEVISTATPSTELSEYTIDLRNYFPFCIPWDLYDMITILVAEPVAPRIQYPFVIEPLNVNYTIDLDFSQFDSVAAVLRTMELLAAGIGLALMTKRLIQGGD